ncbi:CPBP family intramembrane glutamic endopeptidase [Kineosporia babensis]|uniref:CPBP family intramembrane metalloprotease n=1 Tax=Kineosporia babensis TaxID=499548 RepID=A0A9X1SYG6_9ACTN|nr:type II CAAX endopeptidase family protein [Kineosporia babensis]MCD5317096.1 CPBP family intramembrane metalloprotease [Kineosporia babensis]
MLARLQNSTPVRLIVLMIAFLALNAAVAAPLSALAETTSPFLAVIVLLLGVLGAVVVIRLYRWVIGKVESRPATELDPANRRSALVRGGLIGVGIFTAVMLLIATFGGYESLGWGSFWATLATAGLMTTVATIEEVVFRGIMFRLLEQLTGTVRALIISAVLFGFLHLINPNASLWGAVAIAIQGGLMLGAAYAVTRSLWLPIGLHFGWNFAQAGIFGAPVSGSDASGGGILDSTLANGPVLISGGEFGPEASLFAVLVCSVLTVYFVRRMKRLSGSEARALVKV